MDKNYLRMKPIFILLLNLLPVVLNAQQAATIRETTKRYTTYPFNDPDPVPSTEKIYPYFRFDGFTDEPVQKDWKIVELENDFIKVQIMPEIGGKIWTAYDKKGKKDFLYNNGVIKFRDIAMRGPWTSGGIEANYGIIGHTPNTSTPVDYLTKTNSDGSVSCFISTLDLLTRTRWTLEIKLERDKSYFSTQSFWSNTNPIEQSYYTWMNLGVPASSDLQFIYPGDHYIGHDGENHPWPIDSDGRDLSFYKNNDFGGSKSYHVLGVHSNYFSAYWKDADYGMIRYANREDKLGKKIFLWAQSGEGKIWEALLTDKSGQYVEIQSGRLFNQNMFESSFTPFKQLGFAPYQSDTWTEYWYPYKNIGKPVTANLYGTFSINQQGRDIAFKLDPVRPINDSLYFYNKEGEIMASTVVQASVGEIYEKEMACSSSSPVVKIRLGGQVLHLDEADNNNILRRPLQIATGVDTNTAYGWYLQGRDLMRFRQYREAEPKIQRSLEIDPYFVPALVEMSKIQWIHMRYDSAFHYAQQALSVDTYNGEANYYYGLAAAKLGRTYDALDGFEVASLDPTMQSAAYTALSKVYIEDANFAKSLAYASKALNNNNTNIEALQLHYLSARLLHLNERKDSVEKQILAVDPLNHFIRFEQYLAHKTDRTKEHFISLIRNEMPIETYLELAIWYANLKQPEAAREILSLGPKNVEVLYWLAWLNKNQSTEKTKWLKLAKEANVQQVFPFREESAAVLEWSVKEDSSWRPKYLLALIQSFRNNGSQAFQLLSSITGPVDFAPFHILRARLSGGEELGEQLRDLQLAVQIDKKEWRYGQALARFLVQEKKYKEASEVLRPYRDANLTNYIIGMDYIRTLMLCERYTEADEALKRIQILPFEGATDGHKYFEETKLILAVQALADKKYTLALSKIAEARSWPINLGVGEPFESLKDERIADWLEAQVSLKMGRQKNYKKLLNRVAFSKANPSSAAAILQVAAYQQLGEIKEAESVRAEWLASQKEAVLKNEIKLIMDDALRGDKEIDVTQLIELTSHKADERLF